LYFNFANGQGLADNYLKGSIYLNDGQVIEGYLYFNILNPDQFQKTVSYITEVIYQSVKATDKLRSKDIQEVKAKDAKYFQLADGRKFVTMKFADMSAAGAASIPSYYFFEEIVSGKISLYRRYVTDGLLAITDEAKDAAKEWILSNYQLLIVSDDKVKSISNIAVPDYIADNSEVLAKLTTINTGI
jgi:hypothetical protein